MGPWQWRPPLLAASIASLQILPLAGGEVLDASLDSGQPWQFLADFSFQVYPDEQPHIHWYDRHASMGSRDWGFQWWAEPGMPSSVVVILYDDEDYSWPVARRALFDGAENASATCRQLLTVRTDGGPALDVLPLGSECTEQRPCWRPIAEYARRRYWYAVALDCESGQLALAPRLHLHLTNPGGWFRSEFSVDRVGLLELYLLTLPLQIVFLGAYFWQGWAERDTPVTTSFATSAILQLVASGACLVHYARFATDGHGSPVLLGIAELFTTLAGVVLMGLLVVFASGFTLAPQPGEPAVRVSLRRQRTVLVSVFSVLLLGSLTALAWKQWGLRPEATLTYAFPYDSVPGAVLAVFRLPIAAYFLQTLSSTLRRAPDMRVHFTAPGAFFAVYILSLPVLTLVAFAVAPWVRYRWVEIPAVLVLLAAQAAMGAILWPGQRRSIALSRSTMIPAEEDEACEGNLKVLRGSLAPPREGSPEVVI
eukprot:TRINITY_DN15752_c0_g1_i1.p1 TRINITY_DN15752_c0_g1~~TRINITY_DN15752_c0_g1_i1.p1  ORF type:complete len:517 (+),score=75.52 TRINITY_DN15752_c0_g1_i1:110-1552(+)